jgi:hypothetical protein
MILLAFSSLVELSKSFSFQRTLLCDVILWVWLLCVYKLTSYMLFYFVEELPENWDHVPDIQSLLPLDRSFIFPGIRLFYSLNMLIPV